MADQLAGDDSTRQSPDGEFVQLFTHHQRRLFLYILSQLGNPLDAEEVLQETNVVVWSKYSQFRLGTNFLAWVSQIANFEIMKHRTKKRREKIVFSDEFLQAVAATSLERSDELERRRTALADCLKRLRPKDRELIEQRYAPGERGTMLAEQIGRPVNSVYQSLGRIRRALLECIERQLALEVSP
ncbi:sigma-70 family RNA polymerase sigma factor [Schlesneria paludicola]|uniref:sigma-70 family RNA polymerase sigma factor n=1 Tax=Schlesneria paludicola TaxID=360056 RepID=UPI000299E695|nr:sigma-70 family RNA polymerase sigma factor [Schlesneria paludicola]